MSMLDVNTNYTMKIEEFRASKMKPFISAQADGLSGVASAYGGEC